MKYAVLFTIQGIVLVILAVMRGSIGLFLLWPALAFMLMGLMYGLNRPWWFGKSEQGQMSRPMMIVMLPFLCLIWGVWHLLRLSSEDPYNQVLPTLYIGRRLFAREYPADIECVLDLTCEFNAPKDVAQGRAMYIVPTLDATTAKGVQLLTVLRQVIADQQVVYIHCAQGHGRSAVASALYLGLSGDAATPEDAFLMLKAVRPGVGLNASQRADLDNLWRLI